LLTADCRLSKSERLSWERHINRLFTEGQSFLAFPLRVVFLFPGDDGFSASASILVSVSKKRFKRAVKRNRIKRQIREAYRVRKYGLIQPLQEKGKNLWIAFLYVDTRIHPSGEMEKAMSKAITVLREKIG
jgi:ribonuclease P protein component